MIEKWLEEDKLPDWLINFGIQNNIRERLKEEKSKSIEEEQEKLWKWIAELRRSPIAIETKAANEQHYEVAPEFYEKVLGKRLKYSSCFWPEGVLTLDEAEERMLEIYVERSAIRGGMKVLELGCGWGSFSLYAAERFPDVEFVGVSNSLPQRLFIEKRARDLGLQNLTIVTCDMNKFHTDMRFDRIVSIEMFEHMRNYEKLLANVSKWLNSEGRLFVHIFTHIKYAYPYSDKGESDWMARYFFTGGQMPSDNLLLYFQDDLRLIRHWRVNGVHYAKTSQAWLENMDRQKDVLLPVLAKAYGEEQKTKMWVYWRIFFMACRELFAWNDGNEWLVSHYLFEKR